MTTGDCQIELSQDGKSRWVDEGTGVMNAITIVLAAAVAVLFSAAGARAQEPAGLTDVMWLAEDIGGGGVVDNLQSTLRIEPSGRVSGSSGCNRYNGMAKIDGSTIAFGPQATSRKMCPPAIMDQERKFLDALAQAKSFEIEETFLRLLSEDGVALLRLVKSE